MNKKLLMLCAIMIMCVARISAQEWHVVADNKYYVPVEEVAFMLFVDGAEEFSIVKNDGMILTPVTEVSFATETPNSVESVKGEGFNLTVFPNPVVSTLNLEGLRENATVRILALDGALLSEQVVTPANGRIDVSALPAGMYVMQVNETVVKFIKK